MKNSELLTYSGTILSGLERQRQYVLRMQVGPFECPNCGTPHAKWEIHGIADVDDYDLGKLHPDEGHCKSCGRGLRYCVPLIGGVFIQLIPDRELTR